MIAYLHSSYGFFALALVLVVGCSPQATPLQNEAPTGLARAALGNPAFRWDSTATPRLTLYYPPGNYAAERALELRARAARADACA